MRIFITFCFSIIMFSLNAQKLKLNFEPQKPIIAFLNFNELNKGVKIYTDTSSVFKIHQPYNDTLYSKRIKKLIINELMKTDNDTIFFYGNSIPFNDGFDIKQLTNYQGFLENSWLIENVVFQLMNKNNFKIIGSNGKQVETVQIKKKKGKRPANSIYIVYSDNDTKEKLFDELLYLETPIE